MNRKQAGFTLTSTVVTVAILGVAMLIWVTSQSQSILSRKAAMTVKAAEDIEQGFQTALVGALKPMFQQGCPGFAPTSWMLQFNFGAGTASLLRSAAPLPSTTGRTIANSATWERLRSAAARCATPQLPTAGQAGDYYFCMTLPFAGITGKSDVHAGLAPITTGETPAFAEVRISLMNYSTGASNLACSTFPAQRFVSGGLAYYSIYWHSVEPQAIRAYMRHSSVMFNGI